MKDMLKEVLHYNPETQLGSGNCLGELFPNIQNLSYNANNRGRVFGATIKAQGLGGFTEKAIHKDETAWKQCVACPDFDRCLHVSMANLLFQHAINSY